MIVPYSYLLVVIYKQISRFVQVSYKEGEDDINGEEGIDNQINGQKWSSSNLFKG